jgi:hypothetical protein
VFSLQVCLCLRLSELCQEKKRGLGLSEEKEMRHVEGGKGNEACRLSCGLSEERETRLCMACPYGVASPRALCA